MLNECRQWMILLFLGGMTMSVTAQEFVNQPIQMQEYAPQEDNRVRPEMAPPPPGPYQVDPDPNSASIYYDMRETESFQSQPEPYGGYVVPRSPAGHIPNPYGQGYNPPPAPAPDGYYRYYGEAYGNAYPPSYPGYYSPNMQRQYVNPYGPQQ